MAKKYQKANKKTVSQPGEHKIIETNKDLLFFGAMDAVNKRYYFETRKHEDGEIYLTISEAKIPGDAADSKKITVPEKYMAEFYKMAKAAYIAKHNALSPDKDKLKKF